MAEPRRMLIGVGAGVALGLLTNALWHDAAWLVWIIEHLTHPAGQIFLRLLFMLVVPLLFSALVVGIGELPRGKLGPTALRTLGYTVVVSTLAVLIGLATVNLLAPGEGLSPELRAKALAAETPKAALTPPASAVDLIIGLVPDNPIAAAAKGDMLGWLVFSLIFAIGLSRVDTPGAGRLREAATGLYDVAMKLVAMVLWLAPIGVGCLLFSMTARLGFDILRQLAAYVGVVLLALGLHMFVVYPLSVRFLGGMSPVRFFKDVRLAMLTAFSTASSSATLPTALKVADEQLKLPSHVARFVLTAGSTMNQNGTALFEGVTVLFLAQLFGVELGLGQQAVIMVICVLAGIGTAGVPAGSIPVIAMILTMFGIPPQGLGLILGVDRLLDMCRTTLNVTGDLAAAVYVARAESDGASASSSGRRGSSKRRAS